MLKSSQKAEAVIWKQAFKELHFNASSRKATVFVPRRSKKLTLKPPKLMPTGSAFWMPLVKNSALLTPPVPQKAERGTLEGAAVKDTASQKSKFGKVLGYSQSKVLQNCSHWMYT